MIFKGEAGASVAARESMQLGKLLTLDDAAQRFAKLDNGVVDLRWTLRFCLEAYVRLCIRLPYSINTWERRQQPDIGECCDKCGDIADERELCMYEDADEADMPQYCENCHMTKPPIMGEGDYIGQRWGVLFLSSLEIAELTMPNVDAAKVGELFDFDDSWDGGYCRFKIASDRDAKQVELREYESIFQGNELADLGLTETMRKQAEAASKARTLTLGLSDLFVWEEDFKNALEGVETASRKDLPMNSENKKRNREGGADAKNFVNIGMEAYKRKDENQEFPRTLDNLLRFSAIKGNVQGYTTKEDYKIGNNGKKRAIVFLHYDVDQDEKNAVERDSINRHFREHDLNPVDNGR